jgi:cell division protease FtsH
LIGINDQLRFMLHVDREHPEARAVQFKREHHVNFWYIVLAVMAMLWIQDWMVRNSGVETIPYSQFEELLQQNKVDDLVVGNDRIMGKYKDAPKNKPDRFTTVRVDPELAKTLTAAKVTFSGTPGPGLLTTALGWIMPALVFIGLWMWLVRPMAGGGFGGGLMAIGKSRARIFVESETKVTFGDVAGVDEAKDELKEIVDFLKNPQQYGRLGAHIPKGILLVGPPGTGKTLLARAVAGEAGVPFFSISGSEFVEMFVGVGAARVRDLFEQARKQAPAIVFIDELDALGRARGGNLPAGGNDEKEQTLNQLLAEMDGFDPSIGIVVLGATNRPETLDPALLRPGRFDRQVLVDRPDRKGRADILRIHIKKIQLAPGVSVDEIAGMTPGFAGADLANLVNEAALLATRRNADAVTLDDFAQAVERIVAGLEKRNRLLNAHEREIVAHHEMGHALVAMALPNVDRVQKISIIPRGLAALGYTMQLPAEDRFLMSRAELVNRMTVLLGGRSAESLIFKEISTGAADDLARATEIARSMVTRFGMDPDLGQVAYEPQQRRVMALPEGMDWQPRNFGEETASAIDKAIRDLVDAAYTQARAILAKNEDLLRLSATKLLSKETLTGPDLDEIASAVHPLEEPPEAGALQAAD